MRSTFQFSFSFAAAVLATSLYTVNGSLVEGLLRREVRAALTTDTGATDNDDSRGNADDEDGLTCQEEYLIEGDFCEEACANPKNTLGQASGLKPGTCAKQGFDKKSYDLKQSIFTRADNTFKDVGAFTIQSGCNPHFTVKHQICETFCVGTEPSVVKFAEHRSAIVPGTCLDNGYPKFVGHKTLTTYTKSTDEYASAGSGIDGDDDNPAVPSVGGKNCKEEYSIEGDWCEEACTDPDDRLSKRSGLKIGTCSGNGFGLAKDDMKQAIFVGKQSTFASAGAFRAPDDCNPHIKNQGQICLEFCIGKDPDKIRYAESRSGIQPGTCLDNGFPKFVAHGRFKTFAKSAVPPKQ